MCRFTNLSRCVVAAAMLLLGACAQQGVPGPTPSRPPVVPQPEPGEPIVIDPMLDVPGDGPLPAALGVVEQIDCKTGVEDLHARMALEARGGQVTWFAYYSKWKPRTCSMDFTLDGPQSKWRRTADGATRVQTLFGSFVIRSIPDAYVFEFRDVQRMRFCGMMGQTNGTMTIRRKTSPPQCSVEGLMDRENIE